MLTELTLTARQLVGNLLTELSMSLTVRFPGTDVKAEQDYTVHYNRCRTNVYYMSIP